MRRILLFILPILIVVSMGFSIFGIFQVRLEETRLLDELGRKARAVAESMELSAKHILENEDIRNANRLVEKFQKRERLQGCVLYDKAGKMFSVTERFAYRGAKEDLLENASGRVEKEELGTEARLPDLIRAPPGENSLFVMSNGEPYLHV